MIGASFLVVVPPLPAAVLATGIYEEPIINIKAGYATFSYGIVFVQVEITDLLNDTNSIHLTIYNPDGEVISDKDENVYLNEYDGKEYFSSYYFGIERKYVDQSYKIVATYSYESASYDLHPFTSENPDPTCCSFEC